MTAPVRTRPGLRPGHGSVRRYPPPPAQSHSSRRHRTRRRLAVVLVVALPVVLLGWLLTASSLLTVERVRVSGVGRLTSEQVVQAAAVRPGTPLARVDLAAVRARVAALPPVAAVRVARAWPHTVQVRVTAREAVATRQRADGSWMLLDGTGAAFAPSAGRPEALPQVTGTAGDSGADPALLAAVQVLAQLPPALRGQVGVAEAATEASVSLTLRDGRTVLWGRPQASARKAAVVQVLLGRPGRAIDVSAPDLAVVR